ncbi:hypothetical protein G3I28_07115, partial [Streptomyces sp. SID10116]|nr:hypothetical protein [Streptomyces sp. SID10116]
MSATAASQPQSPRSRRSAQADGAFEPGPRPPRVIQSEATTEIPVHLLFRDDPDDPDGAAGVP